MGSQVGPASGEELREEPVPLSLVVGLVALGVCGAGRGEEAPVTEQGERGQDLPAAPPPSLALAACRGRGRRVRSPSELPQSPFWPAQPGTAREGISANTNQRSLLNRVHHRKSEGFQLSQGKIFKLVKAFQLLQGNAHEELIKHQVSLK